MIDWYGVAVSALWILGLAVLLAALSIAYWSDGGQSKRVRQVLGEPTFRLVTAIGIVLFALGMFLVAEVWWEKGGWLAVIVLAFWESVVTWLAMRARGW